MARTKDKTKAAPRATTRAKRGKAASVKPDDLLTVMVLDDSGSMSFTIGTANVIESVDEYVNGLREDEAESDGRTLLSLSVLNGSRGERNPHVAQPISDIPTIGTWYQPSGGTPLFDSIARSLAEADAKLVELDAPEMKVLHVTVTDGGENQSTDYPNENQYGTPTNRALIALIQEYENLTRTERETLTPAAKAETVAQRIADNEPQGNWTFVYLGAEASVEQAQHVAASMGYREGNAMAYAATAAGASSTMSSLRSATMERKNSAARTSGVFFADAGQSAQDYGMGVDENPIGGVVPAGGISDPSVVKGANVGDVAKATGYKVEKGSLSDLLGGNKGQ
jgi:hypothetical protein